MVEFLAWLEDEGPVRLQFTDKHELASRFVSQRSDRLYREYEQGRLKERQGGHHDSRP